MSQDTTEIWNEFKDNIYHFILKRVKNESFSDDLLQDVFIKVHLNKDKLKDETKIQSWIYQITRNVINDYYNKDKKNSGEEVPDLEDEEVGFYGKQEMFCCLKPFIKELPEKYKIAIELADIDGKKQQEVAEILNISLSGAKSRVQRAREMLKTKFVACCNFTMDEDGNLIGEQDCAKCNP